MANANFHVCEDKDKDRWGKLGRACDSVFTRALGDDGDRYRFRCRARRPRLMRAWFITITWIGALRSAKHRAGVLRLLERLQDQQGAGASAGTAKPSRARHRSNFDAADQAEWRRFMDAAVAMGLASRRYRIRCRATRPWPPISPTRDAQVADLARRYLDVVLVLSAARLRDGLGHDGSLFLAAGPVVARRWTAEARLAL